MRNILKDSFVATNVLMKFEDGSESFCIPEGGTLADVSENGTVRSFSLASSSLTELCGS